jgi:hypothetical protein
MNESIDSNLTTVEQSSLEQEITEANGNGISDAAAIEPKNLIGPKHKPVLIANSPGMNPAPPQPNGPVITPPPLRHDISTEPEVTV